MSESVAYTKMLKSIWRIDKKIIDIYDKAVLEFIIGWQFVEGKRLSSSYIAEGIQVSDRSVKRAIRNLWLIDYIRVAKESNAKQGYIYSVNPKFVITDSKTERPIIVKKWNDARRFKLGTIGTIKTKKKPSVVNKLGTTGTIHGDQDALLMVTDRPTSNNSLTNCTNPGFGDEKKSSETQSLTAPLVGRGVANDAGVEKIIQAWNFNGLKACTGTDGQKEKIKKYITSDKFKDFNQSQHLKAFLHYSKQLKTNRDQVPQEFRLEDFFSSDFALTFYQEDKSLEKNIGELTIGNDKQQNDK